MKRYTAILMSAALVASSCTTGAGSGAYAGSTLGSILGSAIGGIAGGPRGSDIGTIVGMAGGAIVGGALGDAAEKQQLAAQHDELAQRNQRIQRSKARQQQSYSQPNTDIDPSNMVDSSNSGDDRIDFQPSTSDSQAGHYTTPPTSAAASPSTPSIDASRVESIYSATSPSAGKLTIKNVRFSDDSGDNRLSGGEIGHVSFEIYNNTGATVYDFYPTVADGSDNNRIYISPSVRVESIAPGQGIRYTATVKADRRIKTGETQLMVSASKDGRPISYVTVLKVATER